MDKFEQDLDTVELSESESSKLLITDIARSTFDDFADEIMSLYGSQQNEDRLETLSSTTFSELKEEYDKVSYRVLWLEALLRESKMELEMIHSVIEASENQNS